MVGKALFAVVIAAVMPFVALGNQLDNIKFRTITPKDGLSHSNVRSILQDDLGFMWFGTKDGLNRYDGYAFTTYRKSFLTTGGMRSSDVQTMTATGRSQIWISNESGLLDLLDLTQERFTKHALEDVRSVNCVMVTTEGLTWVGTGSQGVYVYKSADTLINHLHHQPDDARSLVSNHVSFIKADSKGRVWVGTADSGISLYTYGQQYIRTYINEPSQPNSLSGNQIRFIFEDSKERIWVGTYGGGLNLYRPETDDFLQIDMYKKGEQHTDPDYVLCMEEDDLGNLWVGRENAGIYIFNPESSAAGVYTHAVDDPQSVSDNTINCIKKDRWGNLWIGTANGGVSVTNPATAVFSHFQHRKAMNSLSDNMVNAFFQDTSGQIWVGTDGGGLNSFDEKTGEFQVYRLDARNPNSLSSDYILSVNQDVAGNLWVGTWGGGVTVISPHGQFSHFKHDPADTTSLSSNYAFTVFKDSKGRMWIGTYGGGLCLYDDSRQEFRRFSYHAGNPRGLSNNYVLCIEEDRAGNIWVGTDGGGLNRFVEDEMAFESPLTIDNGLSNSRIVSIHADALGNIWMATNFGLNKYHPKSNQNTVYFSGNGLSGDLLTAVIGDNDGNIWVSSNHGISVLTVSGAIINYDIEDGLQDNEFRYGKLLSDDGKLYFGGKNGFNTFFPHDVNPRRVHTPVVFTRFQVFNKDAEIASAERPDGLLEQSISLTRKIALPYDFSVFSIDFAMLHAASKERKTYSYKLAGFDNEWQDLGSKNSVTFTNLDPGRYVLQVRGTDSAGDWPAAWSEIEIHISPPFWKTWWFVLLEVLAALGSVVAFMYFRMASVKARNQQLEKEVGLRTQELSEVNAFLQESNEQIKIQNVSLEESNREIKRKTDKILEQQRRILLHKQTLESMVNELQLSNKTKDKLFAIMSHDLKNPITALHGIASLLYQKLPRIDHDMVAAQVKDIFMASTAMNELVVNLLDWSRLQSVHFAYEPMDINVYELIMKNIFLAKPQMNSKGIRTKINVPISHMVKADKHMADAIVRNLLNNGIKFTDRNGEITVASEESDQYIVLTFKDDGIGMSAQRIQEVEQGDVQSVSYGTAGETGTHLGLQIVKEFLMLNGGKLSISSEVGVGSCITISLPKSAESVYAGVAFSQADLVLEWPTRNELTKTDITLIKGKRLLIVEDNDEVRNFLSLLLSGIFEIFEARNGEEGLQMVHESLPDLIVTDMIMPVMDGLTFSKLVKTDYRTNHIPVILLTSNNEDSGKLASYEAGCDVFIGKPINKEILLQVILNLVRRQEVVKRKFSDSDSLSPEGGIYNKLDEEFLRKISDFVEENIADTDLDYRRICKLTAMSRTVLYSKLKALTGMGVHDFIKGIRLRKALNLLKEGRLNISQVAYEVGFVTPSYFTKCFARKYGLSPKEHVAKLKAKYALQTEGTDDIT